MRVLIKSKSKVVTIAIVVAVALIGTGYAAWGTEIFSNTTVRTGKWNVIVDETSLLVPKPVAGDQVFYYKADGSLDPRKTDIDLGALGQYDKKDDTKLAGARRDRGTNYVYTLKPVVSGDKHTVTFDFYNMHPGTQVDTNFDIKNMGSIPAKVKNVTVKFNDSTYENLTVEQKKLCDAIKVNGSFFKHVDLKEVDYIGSLAEDTSLVNLESEIERLLVNDDLMLDPKQSIRQWSDLRDGNGELDIIGLRYHVPMDSLYGSDGSGQTLKVGISFDFAQYNQKVQ